jgi:glycosyltransferase involved in cell wall biosynthesis
MPEHTGYYSAFNASCFVFFAIFTRYRKSSGLKPEKKRIIVAVTSDLVTDNRVHKVCSTLSAMGFDVLLAGRMIPSGLPLQERGYRTVRFRLPFLKGPLFYASYNIRLFIFLLFSKFDLVLANDLDTLPGGFFASRLKGKPLVYDSHEYFTEVPELVARPFVRTIWAWIESQIVPRLKVAYTVNESLALLFEEKYGIPFHVVRNLPSGTADLSKQPADFSGSGKVILYQGAVNINRGLEKAIMAMKYLEGAELVIAGDGDIKSDLERLVTEEGLQMKVKFLGRIPIEQLQSITRKASVGISIEEDVGLNYHFALPNKLFDYIQAHVPVLVSNLPEMAAVVREYDIGKVIDAPDSSALADVLAEMLDDNQQRELWKKNLEKAALELTWENEEKVLHEIFNGCL